MGWAENTITEYLRRSEAPADVTWRAIRRFWGAVAIAGFPFLFIIDGASDTALSPVLPGIIVLVLIWAFVPYGHLELVRRLPTEKRAQLYNLRTKYFFGTAIAWVVVWLVFA